MLKLTMIGHLGRDAEIKDLGGSNHVISFTVAHSERFTDRNGTQVERTTWVRCDYWRPPDRTGVAQYLKKGTQVYIEGTPSSKAYTDKNGQPAASLDCRVSYLELLGSRGGDREEHSEGGGYQSASTVPASSVSQNAPASSETVDDDLPF